MNRRKAIGLLAGRTRRSSCCFIERIDQALHDGRTYDSKHTQRDYWLASAERR
jgi:hypothetical protein